MFLNVSMRQCHKFKLEWYRYCFIDGCGQVFLYLISPSSYHLVYILIIVIKRMKKQVDQKQIQTEQNQNQLKKHSQSHFATKQLNTSLQQTTIQHHLEPQRQKQHKKMSRLKGQQRPHEQTVLKQKRSIKNQSYLMQKVNFQIYERAERNQAFSSNYAHFHMLLYLTIQEIKINIYPSQDLLNTQKILFNKLQQPLVKKQLNQNLYYEFMTIVLRKSKINTHIIHSLMRKIMTTQRQICIAIFPYYFNLFAFVLNKQVIFNSQPQQQLIPYTFQIITEKRYEGNFTREEVFSQMRRIEKLTIQKYHCPQL